MNYHHAYHAGNFADVVKHAILTTLANALSHKDTPFCYLDTHAGEGVYDLSSSSSQKTKEYEQGIGLLMRQPNPPEAILPYLNIIKTINHHQNKLLIYPGSPSLVRHCLRPQDRMLLAELHPKTYDTLKTIFRSDKQVSVHLIDGYQALKAFLPPKERRGLILIDPPYENPKELSQIASLLPTALKRFETGVYAIWYPIKDRPPVERFHRIIKQTVTRPMLVAELSIYPETTPQHLNGCGLLIINPPWQVDEQIKSYLPWLWSTLSPHQQGEYRIYPLT